MTPGDFKDLRLKTMHTLEVFYASYQTIDSLFETPLIDEEKEYIAMCIGFDTEQGDFQRRFQPDSPYFLTKTKISEIRLSIMEILRLQTERKNAVTLQKVSRVEDIYLNSGYRDVLLTDLIVEVKKIARLLVLPVLDNIFISGDGTEGWLDSSGQVVLRKQNSSMTYIGYSCR